MMYYPQIDVKIICGFICIFFIFIHFMLEYRTVREVEYIGYVVTVTVGCPTEIAMEQQAFFRRCVVDVVRESAFFFRYGAFLFAKAVY